VDSSWIAGASGHAGDPPPDKGTAGIVEHRARLGDGPLGKVGQLAGQPQHRRLLLAFRSTQLQLRPDRAHLARGSLGRVAEHGALRPTGDLHLPDQLADQRDRVRK
jgi:hypothetical protein